jgi:hypothetical protein
LPDTLLTYTANYGALRAKEIYIYMQRREQRGDFKSKEPGKS